MNLSCTTIMDVARAGASFPLPIAFEPEDQYWMDCASKLLRGEDVQIT